MSDDSTEYELIILKRRKIAKRHLKICSPSLEIKKTIIIKRYVSSAD